MSDRAPVVVVEPHPPLLARLEATTLSVFCRVLVTRGSLDRALRTLARLPRPSSPPTDPVVFPSERNFRGAGACLARSLARSQYLSRRGIASTIVIGVVGRGEEFGAHAWLEPYDESDGHEVLHRIER